MKRVVAPLCVALAAGALALSVNAYAAAGKDMTKQQTKFAKCAHESKGLHREAHNAFMSKCLKGDMKAAAKIKAAAMKKQATMKKKMKKETPKPPVK